MVSTSTFGEDPKAISPEALYSKAAEVLERQTNLERAEAALAKRHALAEAKELDLQNRARRIRFREDDLKQLEDNLRLQIKKDVRGELTGAASHLENPEASQALSGLLLKMDADIRSEEQSLLDQHTARHALRCPSPPAATTDGPKSSQDDVALPDRSSRRSMSGAFDADCGSEGRASRRSLSAAALDEVSSMCSAPTLDSRGPARNPLPMAHPANARPNEAFLATLPCRPYPIDVYGSDSLTEEKVTMQQTEVEAGLFHIDITVDLRDVTESLLLKLLWNHPQVDTHYRWHPGCHLDRNLVEGGARMRLLSSVSQQAPFQCLFAANGTNRLAFALSDIVAPIITSAAIIEETCDVECVVDLGTALGECQASGSETYHITVRMDTRPLAVAEVAAAAAQWWAAAYPPAAAPAAATQALYSTWYSFHQQLEQAALLQELRRAKSLGMEVVIIDDGWQTDDNTRGYAYCGDWEVAESKFADFSAFVKDAHALGFKVLLWVAVPFVGEFSRAFNILEGCFLNLEPITLQDVPHDLQQTQGGWYLLDPRLPAVRQHLATTLAGLVCRYGVDGFKLDFIDAFQDCTMVPPEVLYQKGGGSVAAAVNQLLLDIQDTLRQLLPEPLIEFRQKYTGPAMMQVGNMIRASDVPSNVDGNRIRTLDLRLLSGATPVHSDPLMWHPADSVESVAMHFIHTLFAVPQVSVPLARLPAAHTAVVQFFLRWGARHAPMLLRGRLFPLGLPALYTACVAHEPDTDSLVAVWYQPVHVPLPVAPPRHLYLVNGSPQPWLLLSAGSSAEGEEEVRYTGRVLRCTGEEVGPLTLYLPGDGQPQVVRVPVGALVEATRCCPRAQPVVLLH